MIIGEIAVSELGLGADWKERIYFTADTHFSHHGILRWQPQSRPFETTEEMNDALTENWNSTVGPDDVVFFLGDLTLGMLGELYLKNLNGRIVVCYLPEHHDRRWIGKAVEMSTRWPQDVASASGHPVSFFTQNTVLRCGDILPNSREVNITMCHYPLVEWSGSYHPGQWQLHGHTHGTYTPDDGHGFCYDVGVDTNGLKPVKMADIIDMAVAWEELLEKRKS